MFHAKNKQKGETSIVQTIMVGLLIVGAFFLGMLWNKVQTYEKAAKDGSNAAVNLPSDTAAQQPAPKVTVTQDQVKALFTDKNLMFGDPNSKVLFVEFSDPSCPYCHIAGGTNPELNAQVGDRFKLKAQGGTYVAPVPEMRKLVEQGKAAYVLIYSYGHGNGELAMQALYCAKEQGKFWQANDLIMSDKGYSLLNDTVKNDVNKANVLAEFLKSALDANKLQTCLTSGKYAGRIAEDSKIARTFGVNGTPGFFVNTQAFEGAYSFTEMQSVVDAALK